MFILIVAVQVNPPTISIGINCNRQCLNCLDLSTPKRRKFEFEDSEEIVENTGTDITYSPSTLFTSQTTEIGSGIYLLNIIKHVCRY